MLALALVFAVVYDVGSGWVRLDTFVDKTNGQQQGITNQPNNSRMHFFVLTHVQKHARTHTHAHTQYIYARLRLHQGTRHTHQPNNTRMQHCLIIGP